MWVRNHWVWRVLIISAILYFAARGPWRALHDSGDFLVILTASKCWLHGTNPYSVADLASMARAAAIPLSAADYVTSPMVYFPPALVLLSPLALLPWMIARDLWLACLVALSICNIVLLARMAKGWVLAVASFLLAFAPLHTGLSKGQPSVLVCGLICLSLFTTNPVAAGLLLGFATCLKPQLAIGFLLLALGQRGYRKVISACVFGLAASGVGVLFLAPGWLPRLTGNLQRIVGSSSGLNASNPTSWYQLVNLHILIPEALHHTPVEIIVYAILVLITAFLVARTVDYQMAVALIASATVLIGYHRFYETQILWLAIPAMWRLTQKRLSLWLWACYAVFLIPGQTMAALWFGTRSDQPWLWVLLRHETLTLLLLWATLAWIALMRYRTEPSFAIASSPTIPYFGESLIRSAPVSKSEFR